MVEVEPEFRERLVPGWRIFAAVLAFVALIAVAYGAVLGTAVGIAMFAVVGALACAVLVLSAPVITAGAAGVSAGRATLPRAAVGEVRVLDPDDVAALRGPRGEVTAFTVLRLSRSRRAVRIAVRDPGDPHPSWILTSRRPEALLAALG